VLVNDPHVESLEYELVTDSTVSFKDAASFDYETADFKLHLERGRLSVSMVKHHASKEEARRAAEQFLRDWELDQAIQHGRRLMRFEFKEAHIIDRNPPCGGVIPVGMAEELNLAGQVTAVRVSSQYPPPPVDFVASSEVETLWNHYDDYLNGRRKLADSAYSCYTFITEEWFNGTPAASNRLNISGKVLDILGRLAGRKGERKHPSEGPYSNKEKAWLDAAIRLLIRRVGEQAAGVSVLPRITKADLPQL
jgi:hypothetical protein